MELVEGQPLSFDRPWHLSALEDIALQVLDVLDYLHRLTPPVIHRDVKPGNLVLRPDGRVMLIDFGSVRTALAAEGGSTLVGTFGYLAPEQLHGAATPTTDLYSLGMTLAALAAGQEATALPRSGLTLDCARILPEGRLRALVAAMTAPDPAARPASARAAREILAPTHEVEREPVFTATGSAEPAPEPDPNLDEPIERPRGFLATLVSLVIWLVFSSVGLVLKLVERIVTSAQAHELERRLHDERKVTERARRRSEALAARHARDRERLAKTRERFTRIADRFDPLAGPPQRRGGRHR